MMAKILDHFEFREDRRRRQQQEKARTQRQEEESARQKDELFQQQELLKELSKSKSETLSEKHGIPDYTE
jgi:hypothetical protein